MLAITSFPRSGNHLYRFILEFVTGSFTQGIIENKFDVPIFKNSFPSYPECLKHVDPGKLLGIKCHEVEEVYNICAMNQINGIHMIVRNPYDALSSHIFREPSNRLSLRYSMRSMLTKQLFIKTRIFKLLPLTEQNLIYNSKLLFRQWSHLMRDYYQTWKYMKCSYLISYENLTNKDLIIKKNELLALFSSISHLLVQEKVDELIGNLDYYYKLSASAEGRPDWGGIRSNQDLDKSKERQQSFSISDQFSELITHYIQDEINYCSLYIDKHPGYIEYDNLLKSYIK